MKRTVLALSLLWLLAGTAPASSAFLGENPRLGESFPNTTCLRVSADVSRELSPGSGGSCLERPAECFVAPNANPYSNLTDSPSVGPGKNFTQTQKANIYQENMANNGGVLRSDLNGEELVMPSKSVKGVTPPTNEAQIDHNIPRNPADPNVPPGTNSYNNARVLSRQQNRIKSNN